MEDASSPVSAARSLPRGFRRPRPIAASALGVVTAMLAAFALAPAATASPNLNPFARTGKPTTRLVFAQDPAPTPAPAPAPQPPAANAAKPPAPTVAVGDACRADDQCPTGTICEGNRCTPVEPPIRALLFRKQGGATAFYPFYFAGAGNPGYRVFAPIYWHFWSPEERSKIVFPFYWHFEDHATRRTVTVVPPYSHTVQPDAESWAVWPIFYKSTKFGWAAPLLASFKIENPDERRAYGLYALLYFWKRNERAGTSFDLLFPFFASKRSNDSAFTFFLPLNFYWRDGEEKNLLLLPLLWSGRGPNGKAHDVVFPLVWSFRSPESSTTVVPPFVYLRRPTYTFSTLFPLYWAGYDTKEGSGWRLVPPLFYSRSTDHGRTLSWITPVGGYRRDDNVGTRIFGMWVPPMLFQRDSQSELDMVLGLYWRHKNRGTGATTWVVGPFIRHADHEGSTSTLFPLFWHFRENATNASAHSFFPLYFRRSNPRETMTAAGVFPLWVYYRGFTDGGYSTGLFPLAFFGSKPERGHGVVFPLFWHFRDERSTATLALPFFYRFADKLTTNIGVPPLLYFYSQSRHDDGAGGMKADSSHVQFPFFWRFASQRTGVTSTAIPPFYWRSGHTGWSAGLFPLLFTASWKEKGHFVLFPIVWHLRDSTADKQTTVVANYMHRRHGNETTDAFFPLFYFRRGARPGGQDETSFTLFPLFHYKRTPTTKVVLTPIAGSYKGPERKGGLIPPFFWYESREVAAKGVPLLYLDLYRKASHDRARFFGPFVATDSPTGWARVLFPLFARYRDNKETGTWVFPTYYRRRHEDSYALDSFVPLFWLSRSNQHRTTVVGPFYRSWTQTPDGAGKRTSTGFVPLFLHASSPDRRYLITPFFYDRDDYKPGTGRLIVWPLFYRGTNPDGHTTVGFPLYWASRNRVRSYSVFFPLVWHFANFEHKTSTTIVGPFFSSREQSSRTRGILPLMWYSRDDEKKTASHAVMPLFYEKHGPNERKLYTVPFGFGRTADSSFWYLIPFFRRQSATSSFTTLFPLFFHNANRATQTNTTLIPPIAYFSRSRPDRSLTGLALLFWRHRDIGSTTTLALPIYYDVNKYYDSRMTLIAPVFLRYWRASDQTTYSVAPLFYRRANPETSTTVFFPLYWDFKGTDRRTTVLFPFFGNFRRPTYVSRYIFPNIYYRRGEGPAAGTSRLFIFPLWESGSRRPGDTMWEVLLGLFGYERIGRNRYVKVFFIPFELEPAPAAQTAWYGRPKPPKRRERQYGLDARAW
jgi:hypothetical protein